MTGKARGGLGRGLAALIPTGPDTTTVADVLINGAGPRREHGALSLVRSTAGARPTPQANGRTVRPRAAARRDQRGLDRGANAASRTS